MAQTALTTQVLKMNNYAVAAGDLTVTMAATDVANGNSFVPTGAEILLLQNTDASAHTVTISSAPDSLGRSDTSLTNYSIAAGAIVAIQMKQITGWSNGGKVNIASSSALVKIAVLQTS